MSLSPYARLSRAIQGLGLPLALVDLDALDRNIDRLRGPIAEAKKTLRITTKSVRSPEILRYVQARLGSVAQGWMTYTVPETVALAGLGFDDLLVAYPTVAAADARALAELTKRGVKVALVVDDEAQLPVLEAAAAEYGTRLRVVVEVDCSYRPLGGRLHLGVQRSPLRSSQAVVELAARVTGSPTLSFAGIMGYEALLAGLTDEEPGGGLLDPAKRGLKRRAEPGIARLRAEVRAGLAAAGISCPLFNGGGTGSVAWSARDPTLTEVSVGSGFLAGGLFGRYRELSVEPAAVFALQVVRRPEPGMVTCLGGGFVASGEAGPDRLPTPLWPEGLSLLPREGAGEVQTPLRHPPGLDLPLGSPVFFRHAKSGELAEHVLTYRLVRGAEVVGEAPTYRGLGWCFLG